jgi:hypothetical protein
MDKSTLIATCSTVALVLGLVLLRLLFGASQLAAGVGLGRGPRLPESWRRWLFGERKNPSR